MVPYLNNLSEEALFGSNKIKKQYETMKLQNEEFHVLPIKVALLMRRRSEREQEIVTKKFWFIYIQKILIKR